MRKIRNKERCTHRGPKLRYSVWRATYNKEWEEYFKEMAERICIDHELKIENFMIHSKKNDSWEQTYDSLKFQGYNMYAVDKNRQSSLLGTI